MIILTKCVDPIGCYDWMIDAHLLLHFHLCQGRVKMATVASNSVRISRTFSTRVGSILKCRNGRLLNQPKRYLKTQVTIFL